MIFSTPSLEYGALSPMLIILGAAVLAVIVEAFVSPRLRPSFQLALSIGAVLFALGQVVRLRGTETLTAANNSVIIDGPVLFMQGTILVFALLGLFLIADFEQFAAQASAIPGSSTVITLSSNEHRPDEINIDIY
ncbi:MAG: NADH-quinone oxidoreductase subunit N, partial [Actinomycetota bacterium]